LVPVRNTSRLAEICAHSNDRQEASELANAIGNACHEFALLSQTAPEQVDSSTQVVPTWDVKVVDPASLYYTRDNGGRIWLKFLILGFIMGTPSAFAVATATAAVVRFKKSSAKVSFLLRASWCIRICIAIGAMALAVDLLRTILTEPCAPPFLAAIFPLTLTGLVLWPWKLQLDPFRIMSEAPPPVIAEWNLSRFHT